MNNKSQTDTWTPRKRMRTAMSGHIPDCVPTMPQICFGHCVNILRDDYRKGIAEVIQNPYAQYDLMLEIAKRYKVDGLRLFLLPEPYKVVDDGQEMVVLDPKTNQRIGKADVMGGGAIIFDEVKLVECSEDIDNIPACKCDDLLETSEYISLKKAIETAHKDDFFAVSSPVGFTMNNVSDLRGRQRALLDLILNPDMVRRIIDKSVEIAIEQAKAMLKCGADGIYIGDPSSSASLISPAHFDEFCLPAYKLFCNEIHKTEGALIYLHICGNSKPILEMMADTGADCIEPLDPLGGVEVADAKERIGNRVALMGGVNTVTLLEGSAEEVYEEARACCRAGGPGGGYILAAGDMVPDFSPEANVRALIQAAKDYTYAEC
jgi:MtaA/CmuA family methyltransferase